jgi:PAS domain S-box-containing protein
MTSRRDQRSTPSVSEAILDAASEAIFTVDGDGVVLYLNGAAEQMFDLDRESASERTLADLVIGPGPRSGLRGVAVRDLLSDLGQRRAMRGRLRDGGEFPVEVMVIRSSEMPRQYTGFVRDLSASEEEGRQRTRMVRLLNDAEELAGIGSFEVDLRTHEVTWSDALYRLYGYRPGEVEVTIERILARTHPDEQRELRLRNAEMFEAPYPARREYRIQLDDGAIRHLIANSAVERDESDTPIRLLGVVQDVTDLRREQQQLARMQRLLEKAEQVVGMGSYELDLHTAELIWSDEMYRLHGFEPGQIEPSLELGIGRLHPDDRAAIQAQTAEMFDSPRQTFDSPRRMTAEYRIQLDDGTIRYNVANGAIERDGTGEPLRLFGTVRDVTEQRLTERELQSHYALTQALSEWHSFEHGVVDLLRRLGTAMDWDVGSIWVRADRGDSLICRAFWAPASADLEGFEHATRASEVLPGERVVRRAWKLKQPVSIDDASTDPNVSDRTEILEAGLRSALLFPAMHEGETLAVLAFCGTEPRRLTARLIRTLSTLGRDLGRFLAQRRAEIGFRPLSARELEVLQLAAHGLSRPMIAEQLIIGPATVKTHFEHIYEKLGVTDRAAAVAEAMRQGLIS